MNAYIYCYFIHDYLNFNYIFVFFIIMMKTIHQLCVQSKDNANIGRIMLSARVIFSISI